MQYNISEAVNVAAGYSTDLYFMKGFLMAKPSTPSHRATENEAQLAEERPIVLFSLFNNKVAKTVGLLIIPDRKSKCQCKRALRGLAIASILTQFRRMVPNVCIIQGWQLWRKHMINRC